jgi:spore germination cell wall hydrolase CwlJ-like protein
MVTVKPTAWTVQMLVGAMLIAPHAARAQVADTAPTVQDRSLVCLAQAISYEAGNESIAGQEAVAQVVINRLRHPAYPKTICGVVYQGSTRKTGCQFTFTCDGSLRRPRSAQSMATAMEIARRVLAGSTSPLVRGATHYHADYVAPYWAPSLVKIAAIGAHIFYRMPGAPDTPAAADMTLARADPQSGVGEGSGRLTEAVRTAPTQSQFSPWGLPTLTITPSGEIRPLGR